MGAYHAVVCLDCHVGLDLGKWWDWAPASLETLQADAVEHVQSLYEDQQRYDREGYGGRPIDHWIMASTYLHAFYRAHNGHRVWMGSDGDDFVYSYEDREGIPFTLAFQMQDPMKDQPRVGLYQPPTPEEYVASEACWRLAPSPARPMRLKGGK